MAVKKRQDALPQHLTALFERNPTWTVNVCDNECKDHFMTTSFANTSLSWAYFAINPLVGAARADIWRYCVLYSFGGLYLDDDSDIGIPLDQVVLPADHMVLSEEGPSSLGECYAPSYHLSDLSTFSTQRFGLNATHAHFYSPPALVPQEDLSISMNGSSSNNIADNKTLTAKQITTSGVTEGPVYPLFFHGNTLVNWGLFVKPKHPLMLRTLRHIVEVISSEYSRNTVLLIARWDIRWKLVMCSTNFVMTNTLREMTLENSSDFFEHIPRILQNNFATYRGRVKAIWTGNDPSHYMKLMQREGTHLLREHAPISHQAFLALLHGKAVMGDAPDRAIYLILNGTRRMFPDYDTFMHYNITTSLIKHLKNKLLWSLPQGPDLVPVSARRGPLASAVQLAKDLWNGGQSSTGGSLGASAGAAASASAKSHRRRLLEVPSIGAGAGAGAAAGMGAGLGGRVLKRHNQLAPGKAQLRLTGQLSLPLPPTQPLIGTATTTTTATATATATPTATLTAADPLSLPPPWLDATALQVTDKYLSTVKVALENSSAADPVTCWGDDYTGSRDDLLKDRHKATLTGSPVLVYPMCLRLFQLGNTFGYYINDIACADASGAHFLGVRSSFSLILPEALATPLVSHLAFFEALPYQLAHARPRPLDDVKKKMRQECRCLQYCWENSQAPWIPRYHLIGQVLLPAIDAYLAVANTSHGTILNNATDLCSLPVHTLASSLATSTGPATVTATDSAPGSAPGSAYVLPVIPDVAVQYRCGDNIGFGKTRYGLLPFRALTERIPASARHIYVLADSPLRSRYHAYSSRCSDILLALFKRLCQAFPAAVVVVKRGGDPFLDYARLAHANVTICSASTFCLWPALANPHGQVHFPLTPLVGNSGTNATAKDGIFGPRFHWIKNFEMIKDFKQFRPWHNIMPILEA